MPTCRNCKQKWSVKNILSLGFSSRGKACPYCGNKQYLSAKTQRLFTIGWLSLIFIPFLLSRIELSNKDERLFDK